VGILLEGGSFLTAVRESNRTRAGRTCWRFVHESRAPELPVVLLEDSGALIGLVLALAGVGLSVVTGNPVFDGVGTLAIGILLAVIAVVLASEMKSLLIGEAAVAEDEARIRAALADDERVQTVIHLRTQHLGPDELLVATKVAFDPALGLRELAVAIDDAEVRVRAAVPVARLIYVEPDLHRSTG